MCACARACVRACMCVCINISDVNLYIYFQLAIMAFEIPRLCSYVSGGIGICENAKIKRLRDETRSTTIH